MAKEDYYKLLNVAKNASDSELKKSYRRKAMKYHPDRNSSDPGAEVKFKEVKEAYEVLSDPSKRSAYDQFGHAGVDGSMGGGPGGFGGDAGFSDVFGDVFGDIFGGGGGRRGGSSRGSDLSYNMSLTLEEAVAGTEVKIKIPVKAACGACNGSGARKGTRPVSCGTCHGQGQVRMQQGFFSVQQTCPSCRGSGQQIKDACGTCHGQGRVKETKVLSVKVPAGVDTGDRIRLSGEGEAGAQGAPAGDLYVEMNVKPHTIFKRDGADLFCEVPVSFATACLGGQVAVPTLKGKVKLKIPAESQTGKSFRLRGKGVKPVRGGSTGDLLCQIVIETPVRLTREQKAIVKGLDEALATGGQKHSPQEHGWTDGVKQFFDKLTG